MSMKTVSVVIPNYNGKKYLKDCLDSLTKQTYKDFDIIIVDNCSTDGSQDFIRDNYPEIKLVELSSNTGFANAVNVGIKTGMGRYVFLLNNDTVCRENVLEKLVRVLDKKQEIFSVQAKMLQMDKRHLIDDGGDYYCALGWAFSPLKDKPENILTRRISVTSACAGAALYRRELFDEIGYFDEEHFCYLEDVDLGYRARLWGYINLVEPDAVVYHVGSGSSGSRHNSFKVELTAANNLYFIYKNMPVIQVILNLPFLLPGILIKQAFFAYKGLGKAYFGGLIKGIGKIAANYEKKVAFGKLQYKNAALLQLELWINCIRRLGAF